MITSSANAQIKNIIKLQKSTRHRKEQGVFVVEGRKLLQEADTYGNIEKVYATESFLQDNQNKKLLSGKEAELVSDKVFKELTDTVTPQGVLALVKMPSYALDALLQTQNGRFLLLENLRDPGNLGTIMRTAEGAGMTGVILSRESVDLFNPKVVRATMGAIFRQPFVYVEDIYATVLLMQEKGYQIFGTAMEGSVCYDEADYRDEVGIVIGNEALGVTEQMLSMVDKKVRIPMAGKLESLNAAVAAALFMYETARQRS